MYSFMAICYTTWSHALVFLYLKTLQFVLTKFDIFMMTVLQIDKRFTKMFQKMESKFLISIFFIFL